MSATSSACISACTRSKLVRARAELRSLCPLFANGLACPSTKVTSSRHNQWGEETTKAFAAAMLHSSIETTLLGFFKASALPCVQVMASWTGFDIKPSFFLTAAGNNEVDRSTISYAVDGDKKSKIFNIMFALGAQLSPCLLL